MAGLATEQDILSVPKIELHVHYGGNFSEAIAAELARRHDLDPAVVLPLEGGRYPAKYRDFPDFLRALIALNDLIRTPDDVQTVAAAFARGQAAQGVVYSEVIVTVAPIVVKRPVLASRGAQGGGRPRPRGRRSA